MAIVISVAFLIYFMRERKRDQDEAVEKDLNVFEAVLDVNADVEHAGILFRGSGGDALMYEDEITYRQAGVPLALIRAIEYLSGSLWRLLCTVGSS